MISYTLLIADDEPLERDALAQIFRGGRGRIGDIFVADSGRRAVEIAEDREIDIAILDIKMPGIDGLEAARQIRHIHPEVRIVFVTAFDYFEYARQAILIHADDFLVKPAEDERVFRVVTRLLEEREKETLGRERGREAYHYVEQEFIDAVVGGFLSDDLTETGYEFLRLPRFGAVILALRLDFSSYVFPVHTRRQQRALTQRALRFLGGELEPTKSRLLSRAAHDAGYVFCFPEDKSLDKATIAEAMAGAARRIPKELQIGGSAGLAVSEEGALTDGAVQARIAASTQVNGFPEPAVRRAGERTVSVTRYKPPGRRESLVTPVDERAILRALLERDGEQIGRLTEEICDRIRAVDSSTTSLEGADLEIGELLTFLARSIRMYVDESRTPPELTPSSSWNALLSSFRTALEQLSETAPPRDAGAGSISSRVVAFIEEHYREALSLDRIANHLKLSPTHCSRAFTQQTGETISHYIAAHRVAAARHLLREPSYTIKEIAAAVGFRDANYFTRVFTRLEGISPRGFRDQLNIVL